MSLTLIRRVGAVAWTGPKTGVVLFCAWFGLLCGSGVGQVEPSFPTSGIMPKAETGALRFLEEHPTYDGRGVVVAIFDTGIDPGAPGLQTTSEGKPKIIDLVDASGSGDVDTSTVREAKDGRLEGLSRRSLTVSPSWNNPSGRYHLGLKPGFELFPDGLVSRMRAERREDREAETRELETQLLRELAAWDAAHPQPSADQAKEREELKARLEQLRSLRDSWEDPGPLYDCVVFHDGSAWRAAIDTDEDGDFADEAALTDFWRERGFASFGKEALLNFGVNIYDGGELLSIVVDSGMHGTHVAGIVAGHFPDQPELNGVAPGAQLVSVKIGDTRLGGMETATGFTRGLKETLYTWSSRGPAADGDLGVSLCAPGGAVSPVPNWTLQRSQWANGTSMASPNAAGAVALLVSGLKAEAIPVRPHLIRQALENTARLVPGLEAYDQGRGLLQVGPAFEAARRLARARAAEPRLELTVAGRDGARGLYLREPEQTRRPLDASVRVRPVYRRHVENAAKVGFERRYRLESTAPWVRVVDHLLLVHGGRSFDLRVDPTVLGPGVHSAEIRGWDVALPEEGPVFRLPITVVRPLPVDPQAAMAWQADLRLEPGALKRHFFAVPPGATWAELKVRAGSLEAASRLVVHALQLLPQRLSSSTEIRRYLTLQTESEEVIRFAVTGGSTLEVCLASFWSTLTPMPMQVTMSFRGVQPSDATVLLEAGAGVARVEATALLRETVIAPRADLRVRRSTLRPITADLRPLSDARDLLPEGRQVHELVLTYPFTLDERTTVTPRFPSLNSRLYDGEFESQLTMIFDANRRLEAVDDAWEPGAVSLAKGDHRLRFHLRHDRVDWLELLRDLPLVLDQELPAALSVGIHATPDQALTQAGHLDPTRLSRGERAVFWLAPPAAGQLTRHAQPGDLLVGSLRYESGDGPPAYHLLCTVPPKPVERPDQPPKAEPDERPAESSGEDRWRDYRLAELDRLSGADPLEAFQKLCDELIQAYPDHLPIRVKRLHRLDDEHRGVRLRSVVSAADEVIQRVDTNELARVLGLRTGGSEDSLQAQTREQKDVLIDALYRKGRALAWMELPDEEADGVTRGVEEATAEPPFEPREIAEAFERNFAELERWIDPESDQVALLNIRREWRQGRLGKALELLQRQLDRHPKDRRLWNKRVELLRELGWTSWSKSAERALLVQFPGDYPPF